jgi:hypothetical protein
MRVLRARLARLGPAAAAGGAALLVLAGSVLLSAAYNRAANYNSDDLTMVDFCDDLLAGRMLAGWRLPGAPYLFPDLFLLLPCRLLFDDLARLFLAYTVLWQFATALGLFWVGREAGLPSGRAWAAACLGTALVLAVNLPDGYLARQMNIPHPTNHLGLFPAGLCLVAFFLRGARRGFGPWSAAACCVLGGWAVLSDRLLVPQFLAPIAAATALLWLRRLVPTRTLFVTALLMLGMAAVWAGTHKLLVLGGIRFYRLGGYFSLTTWPELRAHLAGQWQETRGQYAQHALVLLFFAATAWALAVGWKQRRADEPWGWAAAAVFLLSALAGLVPLAVMGKSGSPTVIGGAIPDGWLPRDGFERYMLTLTVLPLLALPLVWLAAVWGRGARLSGYGLAAVAVFVVGRYAADVVQHGPPPLPRQPYPELARVLDELARQHGCRHGLVGFWEARRMRYLTREHVRTLPVVSYGAPFLHACNPDAFLGGDPHDLRPPGYRFVIVSNWSIWPTTEQTLAAYGEPRQRRRAGGVEVWVYDRLDCPPLSQFLDSLLARRYERAGLAVGPRKPARLGRCKDGYRAPFRGDVAAVVGAGRSVRVTFSAPVRAHWIDLAGDWNAAYRVTLLDGGQELAVLDVPPVSWPGEPFDVYGPPGLRARLTPLPPAARGRPWDQAVIRCKDEAATAALGHFLAVPGPDQERR